MTGSLRQRLLNHQATKVWWGEVATVQRTMYPSRAAAEAAEDALIRREAPRYNLTNATATETVQSGISWSPETERIIRAAKARTGKTRRALVEESIAALWSD